jgi:lipopolysaccharide/colanic/teichoic acid biosynthesis glycosyltransferase
MIRVLNVSITPASFILLILESVLLLGAFVLAVLMLGSLDPADYLLHDFGIVTLLLVVLCFLAGMHFQDLYARIRVTSRVLLVQQLCMVAGTAFLAEGLISYLYTDLGVSVGVMMLGSVIAVPCIFIGRLLFSNFAGQRMPKTRLVMVGRSPTLTQLRNWIEVYPESGLVIEDCLESAEEIQKLEEISRKRQPPQLIFAETCKRSPELIRELTELRLAGLEVHTAAAAYELACGRLSLYSLVPEKVIYSGVSGAQPQGSTYQLLLHGFSAAVCFLVTLPVLICAFMLLRLSSRGPVWCTQPLMGLNGRVFQAYGLRANGDGVLARAVRRMQLETLPRFLNVMQGDMAIVGPRPEPPEVEQAIEEHIPFYRERYTVRPGMTGWAQVHLNPIPGFEDTFAKLEYDLYYTKHKSFALDTLILLHTFKSMLILVHAPAHVWNSAEVAATHQ